MRSADISLLILRLTLAIVHVGRTARRRRSACFGRPRHRGRPSAG